MGEFTIWGAVRGGVRVTVGHPGLVEPAHIWVLDLKISFLWKYEEVIKVWLFWSVVMDVMTCCVQTSFHTVHNHKWWTQCKNRSIRISLIISDVFVQVLRFPSIEQSRWRNTLVLDEEIHLCRMKNITLAWHLGETWQGKALLSLAAWNKRKLYSICWEQDFLEFDCSWCYNNFESEHFVYLGLWQFPSFFVWGHRTNFYSCPLVYCPKYRCWICS